MVTRRKPLIALSGKSGAGKSTLAEALATLFDVPRDSFAAPIRWALQELGVKAPSPRWLMQQIGQVLREYDEDHFVQLLEERNPGFAHRGLIIDDLRFENEFRWAKERGFLTVYLEGSFRPLSGPEAGHVSETSLSPELPWDLLLPAGTSVVYRVSAVVQALKERELVDRGLRVEHSMPGVTVISAPAKDSTVPSRDQRDGTEAPSRLKRDGTVVPDVASQVGDVHPTVREQVEDEDAA